MILKPSIMKALEFQIDVDFDQDLKMMSSNSYCFSRETEGTKVNLITEITNQQIMDLYSTQNLLLILTILNNNSSIFNSSSLVREVVHSNLQITETNL